MTAITQPPSLPLLVRLQDFKLSLDSLRIAVEKELKGNPFGRDGEHKGRIYDPAVGQLIGRILATPMGTLLSRPCCTFVNAFLWDFGRGAAMEPHLDRETLDITMSIPPVSRWRRQVAREGAAAEWRGSGVDEPTGHRVHFRRPVAAPLAGRIHRRTGNRVAAALAGAGSAVAWYADRRRLRPSKRLPRKSPGDRAPDSGTLCRSGTVGGAAERNARNVPVRPAPATLAR